MASKGVVKISLVLVLMTVLSNGAMSQSDCTSTIVTMSSCLNYIQGSTQTPSGSCCSALENVIKTNPRCLCQVLDGGSQFGITINVTRALALPAACKVQTPPVSRCKGGVAPAPGPDAEGPSMPGSKATPGSDSSSTRVTNSNMIYLQVVGFLVLFVSSCVSKFNFI
ncbi:OLC1v1019995C1 [Oldenlandia corymbosa var. corymbosa]|uniref:OLC1v1019995C1 n=1 Tax=Oldenlandia corymbosa var. corymbosa TaxID=529605 RepID=A0AAV1EF98_OLDCO|nr:OLC1v1019995C1 [Oldenlandia corymbosa var. corymbosa]